MNATSRPRQLPRLVVEDRVDAVAYEISDAVQQLLDVDVRDVELVDELAPILLRRLVERAAGWAERLDAIGPADRRPTVRGCYCADCERSIRAGTP